MKSVLKGKKGERNHKIQLGAGIFLISLIPGVAVEPAFSVIGGLIFLFFLILAGVLDKSQIIQAGLEGEEILRDKLIQILPDEYIAFFSLPLKNGDIDSLVIGPTGVYVLDAKNHRGAILYHNNRWVQKKEGQKGNIYDGNIKNPSRQIEKQIFEIKNLLSRKGIKTWVEGAIVFAHPEAQVFFDNPKNFKILKTDEIEALFRGKRAILNSKTIESITNLISVRYGEGRRADSSRFLS